MKRAFTLIELLVVMAIIALMAGLGLGGLIALSRSTALKREISDATLPLVAAPARARTSRLPAFVVLDPSENTITGYALETVSSWHFEEEDVSPLPLSYEGKAEIVGGFAGSAIEMGLRGEEDEPGADVSGVARFALEPRRFALGGYFECFVRCAAYGTDQVLFRWGEGVEFKITAAGRLEGRAAGVTVRNPEVLLNLYRWVRVGFLFSEPCVAVFMDGAVCAEDEPADFRMPETQEAQLSSLRHSLRGEMDEARLARVVRLTRWQGRRFRLDLSDTLVAWYTPEGTLDPDVHTGPLAINLKSETDDATCTITIDTSGEVHETLQR